MRSYIISSLWEIRKVSHRRVFKSKHKIITDVIESMNGTFPRARSTDSKS